MMKVLLLFNEMLHFGYAASARVGLYARGLEANYVESEILIPFGFKARDNVAFERAGRWNAARYRYLSFLSFHPRKYVFPLSGFVFVTAKYWGYIRLLLELIFKRKRYDVIFIYEFGILYTLLIKLAAFKKTIVMELCEIPFATHPRGKMLRLLRERFNFTLANGFVVISDNLIRYLTKLNLFNCRYIKIPVLVDPDRLDFEIRPSKTFDRPYMVHTGSLTEQKDGILGMIEAFIRAAKLVGQPISFYLTGNLNDSPDRAKIQDLISTNGIGDRIHFMGFLSSLDLNELLAHADLAVINKHLNEQNYYCVPTKLAEYMLNEIPVIVTAVGEMKNLVKHGVTGYLVPPGDLDCLSAQILELFNKDSRERTFIGKNEKTFAEHNFDYRIHGKRLKQYFEETKAT